MKTVPLSQGKIAMVDDADYEEVMRYRWRAVQKGSRRRTWYAVRGVSIGNGHTQAVYMHHVIMGNPHDDLEIDHRNGDGCDNRQENLRWVTHAQNQQNRRPTVGKQSVFKGVFPHYRKWRARIQVNGRSVHLGLFATEKAATRAYDSKAREIFGEFGYVNFSRDDAMETAEGDR